LTLEISVKSIIKLFMSDSHGPTPAIDPKLLVSIDETQAEAIFNQGK